MNFIKSMLSGEDGSISSKRVIMFIFTFLFVSVVIWNMATGKVPEQTLQGQLFYLVIWSLMTVFGEPAMTKLFNKDKAT